MSYNKPLCESLPVELTEEILAVSSLSGETESMGLAGGGGNLEDLTSNGQFDW